PTGGPQSRPPVGVSALPGSSLESRTLKHDGLWEVAPGLTVAKFPSQCVESPAELGLEAAVGRRVEVGLPQAVGDQLLVADPAGLVVRVAVSLASTQLLCAR